MHPQGRSFRVWREARTAEPAGADPSARLPHRGTRPKVSPTSPVKVRPASRAQAPACRLSGRGLLPFDVHGNHTGVAGDFDKSTVTSDSAGCSGKQWEHAT